MSEDVAGHTLSLVGARTSPQGNARCRMTWGHLTAYLTVDEVLNTARELMAAAAYAETDKAMVEEFTDRDGLDLDLTTAGMIIKGIRERRTALMTPTRPALRIEALYGYDTRLPLVNIGRGSLKEQVSTDTARSIAQQWAEVAVSTTVDARIAYALEEFGIEGKQAEAFFERLRDLGGSTIET